MEWSVVDVVGVVVMAAGAVVAVFILIGVWKLRKGWSIVDEESEGKDEEMEVRRWKEGKKINRERERKEWRKVKGRVWGNEQSSKDCCPSKKVIHSHLLSFFCFPFSTLCFAFFSFSLYASLKDYPLMIQPFLWSVCFCPSCTLARLAPTASLFSKKE